MERDNNFGCPLTINITDKDRRFYQEDSEIRSWLWRKYQLKGFLWEKFKEISMQFYHRRHNFSQTYVPQPQHHALHATLGSDYCINDSPFFYAWNANWSILVGHRWKAHRVKPHQIKIQTSRAKQITGRVRRPLKQSSPLTNHKWKDFKKNKWWEINHYGQQYLYCHDLPSDIIGGKE